MKTKISLQCHSLLVFYSFIRHILYWDGSEIGGPDVDKIIACDANCSIQSHQCLNATFCHQFKATSFSHTNGHRSDWANAFDCCSTLAFSQTVYGLSEWWLSMGQQRKLTMYTMLNGKWICHGTGQVALYISCVVLFMLHCNWCIFSWHI